MKLLLVLITIAAYPSMGQRLSLVDSSVNTSGTFIQKEELKNGDVKQSALLLPDSLASRFNQLEAEFREKIEDLNTKTSSKSQRHEIEIVVLKTQLEEEKNFSKKLSVRISQLEALANQHSTEDDQLLSRPKRPYRLLPPHISIEKNKKDGERNQQFFGPATNCDELGLIGYTLNGYYLVKKTTDATKKGRIGIVYCQFQHLHGPQQISQEFIGNVDIKKRTVHFNVQKRSSFNKARSIIPFEMERLNEGNAFNLTSGIFTAPVAGIYHFEFSAQKDAASPYLSVFLQVNGVNVARTYAGINSIGRFETGFLTSSLRLQAHDKVSLYNWDASILYESPDLGLSPLNSFTGWLVEEDV